MGIPAIELTEPAIPDHLGQVVGSTSSDCYRSQWSHPSLRHENEKTVQQTNNQKRPRANFISLIISLKQSAESHYNKQKPAVLNSGKQRIQWIKSIYSHKGSNKRELRQWPLLGKLEDMAKERRKTSCSTSQAFFQHQPRQEPSTEVEADDTVEEGLMELRLAQKPPSAPASGYLPQALEDGP